MLPKNTAPVFGDDLYPIRHPDKMGARFERLMGQNSRSILKFTQDEPARFMYKLSVLGCSPAFHILIF